MRVLEHHASWLLLHKEVLWEINLLHAGLTTVLDLKIGVCLHILLKFYIEVFIPNQGPLADSTEYSTLDPMLSSDEEPHTTLEPESFHELDDRPTDRFSWSSSCIVMGRITHILSWIESKILATASKLNLTNVTNLGLFSFHEILIFNSSRWFLNSSSLEFVTHLFKGWNTSNLTARLIYGLISVTSINNLIPWASMKWSASVESSHDKTAEICFHKDFFIALQEVTVVNESSD